MILPVIAYGDSVLRKVGEEVDENFPKLKELIANMWDTMYNASGVGIAAPQIGKSLRIFVIDASPFAEDGEHPELKGFKKVFINPIIEEESGKEWAFKEGCLSIPEIREEVKRKEKITISYYNEKWELIEEQYDGIAARIIQHEYDHVEGILFIDYLKPLKKQMLKRKLTDISKGKVIPSYRLKTAKK
jgi:peptide deformylase